MNFRVCVCECAFCPISRLSMCYCWHCHWNYCCYISKYLNALYGSSIITMALICLKQITIHILCLANIKFLHEATNWKKISSSISVVSYRFSNEFVSSVYFIRNIHFHVKMDLLFTGMLLKTHQQTFLFPHIQTIFRAVGLVPVLFESPLMLSVAFFKVPQLYSLFICHRVAN